MRLLPKIIGRRAIGAVAGILSFSAAFGRECVIYEAAAPAVAATGATLELKGRWDLSAYGEIAVELARGATAADGHSFCPCAHYAVRLESADGGAFSFGIKTNLAATAFARPIPPDLGDWKRIEALLPKIRLQGLRFLVWPSPYWQNLDGGFGDCSLDPRQVVRVTVSCDGYLVRLPPVKRIVARGPANRLGEQPAFAKLPPEKFFPFLDRYGQFIHRDWPGKIRCDGDLKKAAADEAEDLAAHPGPSDWDKWGGWAAGPQLKATGHFRVEKVDGKWWFVDPDGRLWWSHGPLRVSTGCCLTGYRGREHFFEWLPGADSPFAQFYRPEEKLMWPYYEKWGVTNVFDFTSANLFRKYGARWRTAWREVAHRRLRSWGANTIANGSDPQLSLMDRTPYCDRFDVRSRPIAGTVPHSGWWPFPDPFDPSLRTEMRRQMAAHRAEMDDPWCFGFFVDNEHATGHEPDLARWTWESPDDQPAKIEFRRRLAAKHGSVPATPSEADCCAFSRVLLEEYFRTVREEFKRAAPHKLYLGCRFSAPDPFSVLPAGPYVDVMSFNCYRRDVAKYPFMPKEIDKPVLIGEFHFGAMDRGPIHPALLQCADQRARAEAYRRYVLSALRDPRFVGVHWHQYFDTPATGRFDGENFQNGWVDVCDTPYAETVEAVRWIGENMYRIRSRERVTFDFSAPVGIVKPVNGVGQPPMVGMLKNWDMLHYLREANVPYARLHDVGGWMGGGLFADIPNLFPDFDADENDPKNYRFAYTDSLVDALVRNGVEPFFRLGVTIENFVEWGFPPVRTVPPKDFAKWARICEHVIRHYTEGWADGRRHRIAYWEIWNEPDCLPDAERNPMWHATFDEYVRFYGVVAPYLKAKFPHLKIGGYGSCGFYAGTGARHVAAANSSPRHAYFIDCARTFLTAARDNGWPLDFFSYHSYSSSTQALRQVAFADGLLDEFGFTRKRTERIYNEWMPAEGRETLGTAMHATHIAVELIGLQNGPCDLACIYDARCDGGSYSPLFNPITCGPRKAYYAFKAFGELRRLGLAVRPPATPENVFVAAATDGKGAAAILIANVSRTTWRPDFDFGDYSVVSARVVDETRDYAEVSAPTEIAHDSIWLLQLATQGAGF